MDTEMLGGSTACDPVFHVSNPFRPGKIYNAPVILQDGTDPRRQTATWFDSDQEHIAALYAEAALSGLFPANSYHYVTFDGPAASRSCSIMQEDNPASWTWSQPTPEVDGVPEGVRGSPSYIGFGGTAWLVSTPINGYLQRYGVTSFGDMAQCIPALGCESDDVWPSSAAGPDASAVVVGGPRSIAIWGNKCDRPGLNCAAPYGSVVAAEISGGSGTFATAYDQVDLEAWTFSAPVALSNTAGQHSGELLVVLGTDESSSATLGVPSNPAYDCALATFLWDGSTLNLADHWDDDNDPATGWTDTCNLTAAPDGVNGFVGEPVPVGSDVYALRRRGELYRFDVDTVSGNITREYTVRFDDGAGPTDVWRIPAEHGLVIGDYPDTPQVERIAMFGMNDTADESRSTFVAVDLIPACSGGGAECTLDPLSYEIATFNLPGASFNEAVWSTGAAGRYVDDETGEVYLAYVVATGARVPSNGGSTVPAVDCDGPLGTTWIYPPADCVDNTDPAYMHLRACATPVEGEPAEEPPQLHIFYKSSGATSWDHDWIDLGGYCYEDDPLKRGTDAFGNPLPPSWAPIEVVGPVAIHGTKVYVATDDGRFWEVDTAQDSVGRHLVGYAGDVWPRFRRGNHGGARTF